jgi:hypothetical protein
MFLEKIFIFLWLWILFLAFLSAVNLSAWLATLAVPVCRQAFIEKYMEFGDSASSIPGTEPKSSADLHMFVEKFLRPDGVFLLKMVSIHAGNIVCAKMTEALWVHYVLWRNSLQVCGSNRKESVGSSSGERVRRRRSSGERRYSPKIIRDDREEGGGLVGGAGASMQGHTPPALASSQRRPVSFISMNIAPGSIADTKHYV